MFYARKTVDRELKTKTVVEVKIRELPTDKLNFQFNVNSSQKHSTEALHSSEPLGSSHQLSQSTTVKEITQKLLQLSICLQFACNCMWRTSSCFLPPSISCMNASYWQTLSQNHMERGFLGNVVPGVSSKGKADLRGKWH